MKILKSLIWFLLVPFGFYPDCNGAIENPNGRLMKVTAYCACTKCCGKNAKGITASGYKINKGDKFCAAGKSIPFGTMIEIPSYGTVPVLDRGGAIKGDRLDVYFESHKERIIKNLEWMITQLKYQHDNNQIGIPGNYSPELQEAINLLEELKKD